MSLESFMNEAISPWMKNQGPDADIVISSRVRLARNLQSIPFPMAANKEQLAKINDQVDRTFTGKIHGKFGQLEFLKMNELIENEK
jgi:protein arginine kinase